MSAGGSVSSAVVGELHGGGSSEHPASHWTGWWKAYQLSAVAFEGYVFDHYEVDYAEHFYGEEYTFTRSYWGNPSGHHDPVQPPDTNPNLGPLEYDINYPDFEPAGHYRHALTITATRGVFRSLTGTVKVTVSIMPTDASKAGASATVDGKTTSTKSGTAGHAVTFKLKAKKVKGWAFVCWKVRSDEEDEYVKISKAENFAHKVTIPSSDEPLELDVVAKFCKDTGKVLYADDSGKVIHGKASRVLYQG